jgi:ABC-type uncharacterized transport system involved in gliding motility auxiliary subunit
MQRNARARVESGAFVLIVIGCLVAVNLLAVKVLHKLRFDLTKRGLYSLSVGTHRTLNRLNDQMTVTVYWTPNQPPPANDERLLREQLEEYAAASNGNIVLRYVTTDNDEGRRRQADSASCPHRGIQVVQEGQATLMDVYRCVTFQYKNHTDRLEFVVPGAEGLEYQITTIIKKMLDGERRIGFLTGHDEASPEQALPYLSRIMQEAHLSYSTTTVDLHGGEQDVPADIKGLIIMGPTRRIEERELRRINAYLMRGGAVAVFAGGVNTTGSDLEPTGARAEHNLNQLLEGYGVTINPDLVIDPRSIDAIVQYGEMRGRIRMFTYPALLQEGLDQSHPTVFRLPMIVTPFVSSLTLNEGRARQNGTSLTRIGRTSAGSTAQRDTFDLQAMELWQRRNTVFNRGGGPFQVAVALEGQLRSAFDGAAPPSGDGGATGTPPADVPSHATAEHPARLLVVGSGKLFGIDQLRAIAPLQQGMPTNIEMLLDVFDWLSQDPDLLAVRAKTVAEPDLSGDVSEGRKNAFKWGSILGMPFLIGLLGLALSTWRNKRRQAFTMANYLSQPSR